MLLSTLKDPLATVLVKSCMYICALDTANIDQLFYVKAFKLYHWPLGHLQSYMCWVGDTLSQSLSRWIPKNVGKVAQFWRYLYQNK